MSARACDNRACDYYFPDPPVCDYEPEYSRPADFSWLERCRPKAPTLPRPALSLVPRNFQVKLPETAPAVHPVAPGVSWHPQIVSGGKCKASATKNDDSRRDGGATVIECAAVLEHACFLFAREADEEAILDAEPHLRRVARSLRRLTDQASRARRLKRTQESLFEE